MRKVSANTGSSRLDIESKPYRSSLSPHNMINGSSIPCFQAIRARHHDYACKSVFFGFLSAVSCLMAPEVHCMPPHEKSGERNYADALWFFSLLRRFNLLDAELICSCFMIHRQSWLIYRLTDLSKEMVSLNVISKCQFIQRSSIPNFCRYSMGMESQDDEIRYNFSRVTNVMPWSSAKKAHNFVWPSMSRAQWLKLSYYARMIILWNCLTWLLPQYRECSLNLKLTLIEIGAGDWRED